MKLKQGYRNELRFVIKNKTPNKQGQVLINMQFTVEGGPVSHSTGLRVYPADFDPATQKVSKRAKNYARLSNQLEKIKQEFESQIDRFEGHLTKEIVSRMMDGTYSESGNPAKIDFFSFAEEYYTDVMYADGQGQLAYSTYYNAVQSIKDFQDFYLRMYGDAFLPLSKINVDIVNRYISDCRQRKTSNKPATINHKLTPIIKTVRYAADNELVSTKIAASISSSYLDEKPKTYDSEVDAEDRTVRYLTDEQIQDFVDLYWKVKYNATRDVMDMFMFSFYACGLRVSDILTLEWSHVDLNRKELTKMLVKTKETLTIPLTPSAIDILNRWKGRYPRFVFGKIPTSFNTSDPKALKEEIGRKNRSIVQSLHAIGLKVGLPFDLSMHVARHTFAVKALREGVSVHMISKLLAHGSVLTTEKVYAEFLPKTIDETVRNVLAFDFRPNND